MKFNRCTVSYITELNAISKSFHIISYKINSLFLFFKYCSILNFFLFPSCYVLKCQKSISDLLPFNSIYQQLYFEVIYLVIVTVSYFQDAFNPKPVLITSSCNKEKVKSWVKEQGKIYM